MQISVPRPFGHWLLALSCAAAGASQAAEPAGPGIAAGPASLWSRTIDSVTDTQAWQGPGVWRVAASPYSNHWRYSEEHRHVYAIGIERQRADDWLAGASYFRNSFGQPSAYVYLGRRVNGLLGEPDFYFQWSVGMLYGYRGKYESKVPLNYNGFSPGALVGLGWQFHKNASFTVHALGDAGLMFQFAYDLR